MRAFKSPTVLASLALFVLLFATFSRASADTYKVVILSSDEAYFFTGMSDSGLVVIDTTSPTYCAGSYGGGFANCFYTFQDGVSTGTTTTAPAFTADDGGDCTPTVPTGGLVEHGVCNNGRYAFTGFLSASRGRPGVYTSPGFTTILSSGGEGPIFMDGRGDIVFDDHFTEDWTEAIDLTTAPVPEPSSLLLFATAGLAPLFILRRRILAA